MITIGLNGQLWSDGFHYSPPESSSCRQDRKTAHVHLANALHLPIQAYIKIDLLESNDTRSNWVSLLRTPDSTCIWVSIAYQVVDYWCKWIVKLCKQTGFEAYEGPARSHRPCMETHISVHRSSAASVWLYCVWMNALLLIQQSYYCTETGTWVAQRIYWFKEDSPNAGYNWMSQTIITTHSIDHTPTRSGPYKNTWYHEPRSTSREIIICCSSIFMSLRLA